MDDFNAYIISLLDEDHEEPEFKQQKLDLEKQRLDLEKQRLDLQDKEPLGDRECKTSEKAARGAVDVARSCRRSLLHCEPAVLVGET